MVHKASSGALWELPCYSTAGPTPPIPVADPKKLAPPPTTPAVSRPNSMYSSVSSGSTSTASKFQLDL